MDSELQKKLDEKYLKYAMKIANSADCLVRFVGALVVNGNFIVSEGYNHNDTHITSCKLGGCNGCKRYMQDRNNQWLKKEFCTCVHAEYNAITKADKEKLDGSTLYITIPPCLQCAEIAVKSNIKRVVCYKPDHEGVGLQYLRSKNIEIVYYEPLI